MTATLREAVPSDDAALGELLVEAFVVAYGRKMPEVVVGEERRSDLRDIERKRKAGGVVLVLERSGRIVGTVTVFPPGSPLSEAWLPGAADLRHLAIDPSLHGQGLSGRLVEAAEARAVLFGATAMCLHVRRGAFGVANLYAARGYVRDPAGDLELPTVSLEAFVKRLAGPAGG